METENINQKELLSKVENTHTNFKNALSQFTEAQLNKVPFEGSWTAGQVAEHIILSNTGILTQLLTGNTKPTNRANDDQVKNIQEIFRGKDKMKAIERLAPTKTDHNLDSLFDTLNTLKDQQIKTIKEKDLNALITDLEFPPSPEGLTRNEWLHLMIEHTDRHGKQIDNIYTELH